MPNHAARQPVRAGKASETARSAPDAQRSGPTLTPAPAPQFSIGDIPLLPQEGHSAPALPNKTGLPDRLKSGIEAMSGLSMDDVRVHRNSPHPATLGALAYARGTDIHLGPGQEQHLPHEAWHVVQQKQARVPATMQMKGGTPVNDDASLEREADIMGGRAAAGPLPSESSEKRATPRHVVSAAVQRRISVSGDANYRDGVRGHLQQLSGGAVHIHPGTGEVALHGPFLAPTHGQALVHRLLQSHHMVTVRPTAAGEAVQAEPARPRSVFRALADAGSDLIGWRPWGTTQSLRNRAAAGNPAQGAGATIAYDHQLPDHQRQASVLNAAHNHTERAATDPHLVLAHELIHADHYQRGTGAFLPNGNMLQGTYDYPRNNVAGGVDQEPGMREEMNTVGIPPAANLDPRFAGIGAAANFSNAPNADGLAITENMIRAQFNARQRARYP